MSKKSIFITALIIVAVCSLAMTFNPKTTGDLSENPKKDRLYTVTRGDFKVKVLCEGTLEAIKSYEIKFKGKNLGNVEIRSILNNQAQVKKGDIVVQINDDELINRVKTSKEALIDLETKLQDNIADAKTVLEKGLKDVAENRLTQEEIYLINVKIRESDFYKKKAELTRKIIDLKADLKQSIRKNKSAIKTHFTTIENAQAALLAAHQALKKFINLDSKQKKNEFFSRIEVSENKLNDSKRLYEAARQKLNEAQSKPPAEKRALENNVNNALKQIENGEKSAELASASMRNYMQYGYVETQRNLNNGLERMKIAFDNALFAADAAHKAAIRKERDDKRNIEQNQLYYDILFKTRASETKKDEQSYKRALVNLNKNIESHKRTYKNTTERLNNNFKHHSSRYKKSIETDEYNIKEMVMRAPVDGMISLKTNNRNSGKVEYKVGDKIYPGVLVADIPDLRQFLVKATVPEVYRGMIKKGLKADLYSAVIPDLKISGKLNYIAAAVSHKRPWDKNSPKVYETKFATTTDPRLMPGTTINVEINVDHVKNKLFVPVEALYFKGKNICCKVSRGGKMVELTVKTARRSHSYVEIVEGLQEGDQVFLLSGVSN